MKIVIDNREAPVDFIQAGRLVVEKMFFFFNRVFGGASELVRKAMIYAAYIYGKHEHQIKSAVDKITKVVYNLIIAFVEQVIFKRTVPVR